MGRGNSLRFALPKVFSSTMFCRPSVGKVENWFFPRFLGDDVVSKIELGF